MRPADRDQLRPAQPRIGGEAEQRAIAGARHAIASGGEHRLYADSGRLGRGERISDLAAEAETVRLTLAWPRSSRAACASARRIASSRSGRAGSSSGSGARFAGWQVATQAAIGRIDGSRLQLASSVGVEAVLDAGVMASGLRIGALALAGEVAAAISFARYDALRLERLTGSIGAADLTRAWLVTPVWQAAPGSIEAGHALTRASADATRLATSLRTREASADTRAGPLLALQARGIRPRAWLEVARIENDVPMLIMLA